VTYHSRHFSTRGGILSFRLRRRLTAAVAGPAPVTASTAAQISACGVRRRSHGLAGWRRLYELTWTEARRGGIIGGGGRRGVSDVGARLLYR